MNISKLRLQNWCLDNSITFYVDKNNLTVHPFPDELTPDTSVVWDSYDDSSDIDSNYSAKKRYSVPETKYETSKKFRTAKDVTATDSRTAMGATNATVVSVSITNSELDTLTQHERE